MTSTSMTPAPAGVPATPPRRLRVLVGVHDGVLSGVNTYVEQVAAAAATVADDVTLLVANESLAAQIRPRLPGVRVVPIGLPPATPAQRRLERMSPGYAARRVDRALVKVRGKLAGDYDVAHLNHPYLAATARPLAARVSVAAWFYPPSMLGRAAEAWRHSGGRFPRRAGLALKGVLHHRNDRRGFRAADVIVAPTRALAEQLQAAGLPAVHSTPPAMLPAIVRQSEGLLKASSRPRLLVCAGDLSHPRKNVAMAIDAVSIMAASGRSLELELVGGNPSALNRRLQRLPPTVLVTISGRLPSPAVHERMGGSEVLLFPSLFEEWGYVAVEAALQGTPVVTLPVYPFEEMLGPPIGFCAVRAGCAEYADAIARALDSTAGRATVAAIAAERFGLAAAGRRLASIWVGEPLGGVA